MFFVSDSTTVQAITMKGLTGFRYDLNDPFNTDLWGPKVGVGSTACGVYFRLNPETPILDRSPYIKDCTAFSDMATDGTGHGGAIGIFIEGGKHEPKAQPAGEGRGGKSMVFDAFTNIHSDGVGFWLEDDALLRSFPPSPTTVPSVMLLTMVLRSDLCLVTTLTVTTVLSRLVSLPLRLLEMVASSVTNWRSLLVR